MNATFGITSKSMNSTARGMSDTVTMDVKLVEPCSKHNPIFIVKGLNKTKRYNYVSWNDSYYWIDNVVYVTNDIQNVICRLDPMATFRDAIAGVQGVAIYADEGHWDEELDDIRFSPDTLVHTCVSMAQANTGDTFWNWDFTNSTIVLDVVQTLGADAGFKRYVMSVATFRTTLLDLNASVLDAAADEFNGTGGYNWQAIKTQAGQDLANILGSFGGGTWQDCIIKATWVPIDIAFWGKGGWKTEIMIGAVRARTTGGAKLVNEIAVNTKSKILLTKEATVGTTKMEDLQFLRNPRWLSIQVHTPAGVQVINDPILREESAWPLNMNTQINPLTGDWNMTITTNNAIAGNYPKNTNILARFSGSCGVDMTYWMSNKGNLGSMVTGTASKIIPAVFSGGSFDTEVSSVTTHNKNVITEDNSQVWSSGSITKNIAKLDRGIITTNENSVTTGKKGTVMPSIPNGMNQFQSNGNNIIEYGFANWTDDDNRLRLGAAFYTQCWGPNSFVNDADPYEAYKDYCDEYGYPCNKYLQVDDCTNDAYIQFSNAFIHACPGATEDDMKTINFYLNDGFIWYQEVNP